MCFSLEDIAILDPERQIIDEATFDENWLVYGPRDGDSVYRQFECKCKNLKFAA